MRELRRLHVLPPVLEQLEMRRAFSFTPPSVQSLDLYDDTGIPGDYVTSIPAIRGDIYLAAGSRRSLPVQYDLNGDGAPEGMTYTENDETGQFTANLIGNIFAAGPVQARFRAGAPNPEAGNQIAFGDWSYTFNFTYEPATPTSSGDPVTYLPDVSAAVFLSGVFEPNVTGSNGYEPTAYKGEGRLGGDFTAFTNWTFATGGNSQTINEVDNDPTPVITTWQDGTGTYVRSTSETRTFTIVSVYNSGTGSWTYTQTLDLSRVVQTTFTAPGRSWLMTQGDSHEYTFQASGQGTSNGSYTHDESRAQSLSFDLTIGGVPIYAEDSGQSFTLDASGTNVNNNRSEELIYGALGAKYFTSVYAGSTSEEDWVSSVIVDSDWDAEIITTITAPSGGQRTESLDFQVNHNDLILEQNDRETDVTTVDGGGGRTLTTRIEGDDSNDTTTVRHIVVDGQGTTQWGQWFTGSTTVATGITIDDDFHHDGQTTITLSDTATPGISVSGTTMIISTADRIRHYEQNNIGTTPFTNGSRGTFHAIAGGENDTASEWHTETRSVSEGLDQSVAGTTRSFDSDHTTIENGQSHYNMTSSGTKTVDVFNQAVHSGESNSYKDESGDYTWSKVDSSEVDATTVVNGPGIVTERTEVGQSSSTDQGSGEFESHAQGRAITTSGGAVLRTGSSHHSGRTDGAIVSDHDYETTQLITDTSVWGRVSVTDSVATAVSHTEGEFHALTSGTGTYSNNSSNLHEQIDRDETSTTTSEAHETTTVDVVDNSVYGVADDSYVETVVAHTSETNLVSDGRSTTDQINGSSSWTEQVERTLDGWTQTETTTTGEQSHDDTRVWNFSSYSEGTSESWMLETGTFTVDELLTSFGGAGGSGSEIDRERIDEGTYLLQTSSFTHTELDDDRGQLSQSQTSDTRESFDGAGTYRRVLENHEQTGAGGAYTATFHRENQTEDTGKTTLDVISSVFVSGTENNGSSIVETTYSGWNHEEREGTQSRISDVRSDSVTALGQVTTSVSEHFESEEIGSHHWNAINDSFRRETTDNYNGEERRIERNDTLTQSWGSGSYYSENSSDFTDDGAGYWERSSESLDTSSGSNGHDSDTDGVTTLSDTHEGGVTRHTTTTIDDHENGSGTYSTRESRSDSADAWGQTHHELWTSSLVISSGTTRGSITIFGRQTTATNETTGSHYYVNSAGHGTWVPIVTVTSRTAENTLRRNSQGTFLSRSERSSGTVNSQTQASSRDSREDRGGFNETVNEQTVAAVRETGGTVYSKKTDQTNTAGSTGSGTYYASSLNFRATHFDGTSESAVEGMSSSDGSTRTNTTVRSSSDISITHDQRDSHIEKSKGNVVQTRTTMSYVDDASSRGTYTWRDGSTANFERRITDETGSASDNYRYDSDSSDNKTTRTNHGEYTVTEIRGETTKITVNNNTNLVYSVYLDTGSERLRNGPYNTWTDSSNISDASYNNNDSVTFSTTVKETGNPSFTETESSKTVKTYRLVGTAYIEHHIQNENGQSTVTDREGSDTRETVTEKSDTSRTTVETTRYILPGPVGQTVKTSTSTTGLDITDVTDHYDWSVKITGTEYFEESYLEEKETVSSKDSNKRTVLIVESKTFDDGTRNTLDYSAAQGETNKDNYVAYQDIHEVNGPNGYNKIEHDRMNAVSTSTWDNRNSSKTQGIKDSIRTYTENTQLDKGDSESRYDHDFEITNGVVEGERSRKLGGSGEFLDTEKKGTVVTNVATLDDGTRTTEGEKSRTDSTGGVYNGTTTYELTADSNGIYEISDSEHFRRSTKTGIDRETFSVEEQRSGSNSDGYSWSNGRNETRGRTVTISDTTETTTTSYYETGQQQQDDLDVVYIHNENRAFDSRIERTHSDTTSRSDFNASHSSSDVEERIISRGTERREHDGEITHAVTRDEDLDNTYHYEGEGETDSGLRYDYNYTETYTEVRRDRRNGDGSGTWSEVDTRTWQGTDFDNYLQYGRDTWDTVSTFSTAATVDTNGVGTYTQYSDNYTYDYTFDSIDDYSSHSWGFYNYSLSGETMTHSWSHSFTDSEGGSSHDSDSYSYHHGNSAGGHRLSGWEDGWSLISDLGSNLSYEAWVSFNTALQAWHNPLQFITGVWDGILEYAETQVDLTIGAIDGFLNAINPFDSWWSIPDIGPVFGHTDAYFVGQIVGTVGAVVASIMIGNVAGGTSGLIACGSLAQKAAKLYTAVDTVAGVVQATQNLVQGNAGVSDALAFLPLGTMGLQKLRGVEVNCFEAGTQVLVVGKDGELVARNIEDIQVGEQVWGRDESDPSAPMTPATVTEVYRKTVFQLSQVTVASGDGASQEVLSVTPEHAFYVVGKGWVEASDLSAGQFVVGADGRSMTVLANSIEDRPSGVVVYNLNVENGHTYAVADADGESAFIWTHNACRLTPAQQMEQALDPDLAKNSRAALRRQLGGARDEDAHHIIPLESAREHADVMRRAARGENGFGINSKENGMLLKRYTEHGHGHPQYNAYISRKLANIGSDLSDADTAAAVRRVVEEARIDIELWGRVLP